MRGRDIFAMLNIFKDIFLCVEKSTFNNRSVSRFQVWVKGQVRGMGLVHRDIRFKYLGMYKPLHVGWLLIRVCENKNMKGLWPIKK